jgi:cell division transport system permease protein
MKKIKSGASRQAPEPPVRAAPRSTGGAVQSKTGVSDLTKAYWSHHRESAINSYRRLLEAPLQTLMTALVVAIALALPATLLTGLSNVHRLGEAWDASPKISVYLSTKARDAAIQALHQKLEALPEIAQIAYISPEQAVAEFQAVSGFGQALEALEENPLPPTFVVTPGAAMREPAQLQLLVQRLAQEPLVEDVGLDMDWVRRLQELMVLGQRAVYALAGLLILGVLIAIGNTIRLAIENRRDEIMIIKLVGGTDGFVRRPFLYSGGWYGFFGGVLACILVAAGYWTISGPVARLAAAYHSDFTLQGLGATGSFFLLALSSLLGWLGAWLAVSRHLGEIEPQ